MPKKLDVLKLSLADGAQGTVDFLFLGNKNIYTNAPLNAAGSGVKEATKADIQQLKVVNTVEQLIKALVADRVVARGTVNDGGKVRVRTREFLVARGKADDVIAAIKGNDAGVTIDGLLCKTATVPRNYGFEV